MNAAYTNFVAAFEAFLAPASDVCSDPETTALWDACRNLRDQHTLREALRVGDYETARDEAGRIYEELTASPCADTELASDLAEIQSQMSDLLEQAAQLLRGTPEYAGAEGYWINHIRAALGKSGYRSMLSMQDTINSLEGQG